MILAALAHSGCATHEPEVHPFHIRVTLGDERLEAVIPDEQVLEFRGTAVREDDTSLLLTDVLLTGVDAVPDVRITFDRTALPELAFPQFPPLARVMVWVRVAPLGLGPSNEPLHIPGIRLFDVSDLGPPVSRLILWEGTYTFEDSAARVFSPAGPSDNDPAEDYPYFFVEKQWLESEPGECGLAFYDSLIVGSPNPTDQDNVTMRRGERVDGFVVGPVLSPWTIAHVTSWHRDGECADQSRVYTQFAAWRVASGGSPQVRP